MELEATHIVFLGFAAALLCTAHLCAGFYGGYCLSRKDRGHAPRVEVMPDYFGDVLELVERSQNLHLQLTEHIRELPERVMIAAERLLKVARSVQEQTPTVEQGHGRSPNQTRLASVDRPYAIHKLPDRLEKRLGAKSQPVDSVIVDLPHESALAAFAGLTQGDLMSLATTGETDCSSLEFASPADRRPYPVKQFVAFFTSDLPSAEAFELVLCNDISMGGISFYLNRRPDTERLVIALGTVPNVTFMLLQVKSFRLAFTNEQRCFRIGCQFVRRLDAQEYRWNSELGIIETAHGIGAHKESSVLEGVA